ncbi:MAG: CpaF/VirB11 family protein [Desulfobacula sp.]|uniref:ATPase, T2SS/T4P/T4SS family n=1 Tax=Desulfobacula sp. TaxID=2593537 RepID=UPI0025C025D1|nr:ATPase, T2SS/T4P/T4SS family [Desulfobacula sp.]MCD4719822.1 CpaF/VirB11 family protein [Desulfobacula sp.]
MRPDRIIVGESRGAEVIDMLQAMNTGHPGSMSTVHANSSKDAISRLEVMASMSNISFSEKALKTLIASAIDLIVHITRLTDGKRRITHICEVTGVLDNTIVEKSVFSFDQSGIGENDRVMGCFRGKGHIPKAAEHIRLSGIALDPEMFSDVTEIS